MKKNKYAILLLIFALMLASVAPTTMLAHTEPQRLGALLRNPARVTAAPIGSVESLEPIHINGAPSGQQSLVWNGDLVRSAAGASAQVLLSSIGKVTLRGGAAVTLTTNLDVQMLHATILNGELNVTLKPESSATLEIAGCDLCHNQGRTVSGWCARRPADGNCNNGARRLA
jgi:hypothetical protein